MKIVWFSEIRWDYMRTRKQQLLSELARRHQILFIEPYTLGHRRPFSYRQDGPVHVLTLPALRPTPIKWLNRILLMRLSWLYYVLLHPIMFARLNEMLRGSKIICSSIYFIPLLKWFSRPYYWDYNDDPDQFGPIPVWVRSGFREVLSRAEGIFAPSRLYERKLQGETRAPVYYIPNGVELVNFKSSPAGRRTGVCYLGAILQWSFDFELVQYLASQLPEGTLHLYGPVERGLDQEIEALTERYGVMAHGLLEYERIPATLSAYKVGIVPLKDNEVIRRAASGKVVQYLAAGLMVVSRPMEEYRNFSPSDDGQTGDGVVWLKLHRLAF